MAKVFTLILCAMLFFPRTVNCEEPRNLLIIGWDGVGLHNIVEMNLAGDLPNLQNFLNSGAYVVPLELIGRTNTMASWTMAFTGLTSDQSGVMGNRSLVEGYVTDVKDLAYFGPKAGTFWKLDMFVRTVPYEHTIFKYIKDKGYKIGWITSKRAFLGKNPNKAPLACVALNADLFAQHTPTPTVGEYSAALTAEVIAFMQANNPFVAFVHYDQDAYGHKYGENGQGYLDEIKRCDVHLGEILAVVNPETTRVIVIADHGFDEGTNGHHDADDAWMATNLPIHPAYRLEPGQRAFGNMRDVANTILAYYGIDPDSLFPRPRGKSLLE